MSCQQASRFISTSAASVTPEDPYVFTETVPTTPPFLYNTQKSRPRYTTDVPQTTTSATLSSVASAVASTVTVCGPKTTITHQKLPLGQLNDNVAKAPASLVSTPTAVGGGGDGAGAGSAAVGSATEATFVKNVTKSQFKQNDNLQNNNNNNNIIYNSKNNNNYNNVSNKKIANLCILRTETQHQLQESSPLLQHTPSLWQTPLMLETAIPMVSPPTSPASLPSPTLAQPFVNPIADTTLISTVTAPIAATLPPSKFHHTTLAQHLQKVQSIKKPKQKTATGEQTEQEQQNGSPTTVKSAPLLLQSAQHPVQPTQHSDLNDIPVNVIFRKPQNSADASTDCSAKRISPPAPLLVSMSAPVSVAISADRKPKAPAITTTVFTTSPTLAAPEQYSTMPTLTAVTQRAHLQLETVDTTGSSQLSALVATAPTIPQHETSSITTSNPHSSTPANASASATTPSPSAIALSSPKSLQSSQATPTYISTPKTVAAATSPKLVQSRKPGTPKSQAIGTQKKNRKALGGGSATRSSSPELLQNLYVPTMKTSSAVAVMRVAPIDFEDDTSMLASHSVLPYGLQRHWLSVHGSCLKQKLSREERINLHKSSLRRQAMQYLCTHKLQHIPLLEARQRLVCVAELLEKYQNSVEENEKPADKCKFAMCGNRPLVMASYCLQHITKDVEQQIFMPCAARFNDNTQCSMPVFDVLHEVPLCVQHTKQSAVHSVKKQESLQQMPAVQPTLYYDSNVPALQPAKPLTQQKQQLNKYHQNTLQPSLQLPQQPQPKPQPLNQQSPQIQHTYNNHPSISHNNNNNNNKRVYVQKTSQARKRRVSQSSGGSPLGRPQKRTKKVPSVAVTSTTPPPLTAVLKRKSSTTSLESIASNSHSSSSQPQFMPATSALAPPALAPLSGGLANLATNSNNLFSFDTSGIGTLPPTASIATADDLREHEINQIVAQFASVANSNFNICNGNSQNQMGTHATANVPSNFNNSHNLNLNLNTTSDSHNTNLNFISANSDSNFTSTLGSSSSLPSTDELLTQDMLSICENSSAYASSEDTGLGGLSETELMAGAHDADDIPLGDTRLLEEQDLANVLNALPVDAFNEIFNTVRQDEYDEVERALELADKHLKSLQQTIGNDSDFLGDLLDVNDDFITDTDMCNKMEIVSSVMHSPNSTGIDPSTLFIDNANVSGVGVGNANAATSSCPTAVADVRGLVQT